MNKLHYKAFIAFYIPEPFYTNGIIDDYKVKSFNDTIKSVQEFNKTIKQKVQEEIKKKEEKQNTIDLAFEGFKPEGNSYVVGTSIYENAWNLGYHESTQCAAWASMISKLVNGVSIGGNGIEQAKNASMIIDENGEPMFDYYEYTLGSYNSDSYLPEITPGTIISAGYTDSYKNKYEWASNYGHVFIEIGINNSEQYGLYTTEANVDGNGSIRINGDNHVEDNLIGRIGDAYSYIGIAVPRR